MALTDFQGNVNTLYGSYFDNITKTAKAQLDSGSITSDAYKLIMSSSVSTSMTSAINSAIALSTIAKTNAEIDLIGAQKTGIEKEIDIKLNQSYKDLDLTSAKIAEANANASATLANSAAEVTFKNRQTASFDDQLRMHKAKVLGDAVSSISASGQSAGGYWDIMATAVNAV